MTLEHAFTAGYFGWPDPCECGMIVPFHPLNNPGATHGRRNDLLFHLEDPYGCLSNASRHELYLDGTYWQTVEHYFQTSKFEDANLRDSVHRAETPSQARRLGRKHRRSQRSDWHTIKVDVMRKALVAKWDCRLRMEDDACLRQQLLCQQILQSRIHCRRPTLERHPFLTARSDLPITGRKNRDRALVLNPTSSTNSATSRSARGSAPTSGGCRPGRRSLG